MRNHNSMIRVIVNYKENMEISSLRPSKLEIPKKKGDTHKKSEWSINVDTLYNRLGFRY